MKHLLLICGLWVATQGLFAQQPVKNELPDRYFNEGKDMFLNKNYTGAIHSLNEFLKCSTDAQLITEADYMLVCSSFFKGNENAELQLKEFLDTHPETYHRNQICFYIGTCHFDKQEWGVALFWFDKSNVDYLSVPEQEDYTFRSAYANLQEDNNDKARQQFTALSRFSSKYATSADYYLAYIDFRDGEYDKALPVFEKLKNNPEYREEASFFVVQGYFIKNDLEKTVSEGSAYLRSYPNSKNTKEIYRLLGNSYNRLLDTNSSIRYYEKYLSVEDNPVREDMYLLGTSYAQTGDYQKATSALEKAASSTDKLGQAAYMKLGQCYLHTGANDKALMAFETASRVDFDPTISEAALYNYALLVHQTSLSVFDQPVAVFQRFLTTYPQSKHANQVNEILASAFLSSNDYTAALNTINTIKSPGRQILQAKQIIYFRLGTDGFVNKNYTVAGKYFDDCIAMGNYDPKSRNEAYFWKGEIAYRGSNYEQAAYCFQTYLQNAAAADPNYALGFYNLGYSYFQTKQYANALTNFQRYASVERDRKKPNYSDALNRIGDCYLYNRNFGEAENYYARAAATNPSSSDYAEFQRAFVLGLQRNYTGKIATLDNMMRKYPHSPYYDDALFEKNRALVMLGREQDAIATLEKLLAEQPQSPLNGKAGVQLGQLYFNANNHQKAIKSYEYVIGKYPFTEEARMAVAGLESVYKDLNDIQSYASYVNSVGMGTLVSESKQDSLSYLAAENTYMKGSKTQAKSALGNYLNTYPNGLFAGDAHYLLGSMAFEQKELDTALKEFGEVVRTSNPKYLDDALIYISGIQFDRKNYEASYEAYETLSKVTVNAENRNTAYLGMLRTSSLLGNDQEVIGAASTLLENDKTSPEIATEATYYRAKSLMKSGQTTAAIKDFQTLAADTRNVFGAEAQYILAENFFKEKAYDKAKAQVQGFMKQGTPHQYWLAKALIVLSDCYAAEGDDFQAKQYLESLKANYTERTDIIEEINKRLK